MPKLYRGRRVPGGPAEVLVVSDGESAPLKHQMLHSPSGFEWGYGGSGPADLARSLCYDALGYLPGPVAIAFVKDEIIAKLEGDTWEVPASRVLDSIARSTGAAGRFDPEVCS